MQALVAAGVTVDSYYASEIYDKSIQVSRSNHDNITHIGSVVDVSYRNGELTWKTEDGDKREKVKIDLVIGGSPCQNFSNLGNKKGITGEKSILALQFFRLVDEIKPKWYLLENVTMGKNDKSIFHHHLGVNPVLIDSAIFGPQMRKRNYWTNIPIPPLPSGSQKTIQDIIEEVVDESNTYMDSKESFVEFLKRKGISSLKTEHGHPVDPSCQIDKTRANRYRLEHVRAMNQKSRCLSTQCGNMASTSGCGVYLNGQLRNLLPEEVERLQGLPSGYTNMIPKTYRYKVVGDGWHVPTITHIFSGLKSNSEPVPGDECMSIESLVKLNDFIDDNGIKCSFEDAVSAMLLVKRIGYDAAESLIAGIKSIDD
jgi:site-specific DNA-cytosine methylase